MASVSMMASFAGGAAVAHQPLTKNRRAMIMAKAAACVDAATVNLDSKVEEKGSNGRRAAMFAAAAAALTALAGSAGTAFADEPKRGTPEAKKKYAPVCVTMPTARVCHKIA